MSRRLPRFLFTLLVLGLVCICALGKAQNADTNKRFNQLLGQGSTLVKEKKYDEAREKFEAAARLKPDNHHPYFRIADTYRREKEWEQAAEYAQKAFDRHKEWRSWVIMRDAAKQFVRQKEYEKAVPILEQGLEYRPDDTYNYDLITQALTSMEERERVVAIAEKGLAVYFNYYEKNPKKRVYVRSFITYWARALFHLGRLQKRIEEFESDYTGDRGGDSAQSVRARMYVELGRGLYDEARYDLASGVLEKARKIWPKDIEAHRLYARAIQQVEGRDAAIEALQGSLQDFPDQRWIVSELATNLYAARRYEEALVEYRKLVEQLPENRWYIERVVLCLTSLERYEQAAEELHTRIEAMRKDVAKKPHLRNIISQLESRNLDVLDRSGILQRRLDTTRALLVDQPTSAPLHNRIAEYYMHQGRCLLALSHHLQAAHQSGDADELVNQASELVRARREAEAMPYVHAVIDHFPTHKRIFEILSRMVQMHGVRGRRRFALDDKQIAALKLAENACRRVLEQPDIEPQMKVDATIAALKYHYEALPNEPGLWMQARTEAGKLLKDEDLRDKQRAEVLKWMADIDSNRLEDAQSAYNLLLEAARLEPDHSTMNTLADVALNMTPRPDPKPLRDYIADTPSRNRKAASLRLKLIQWLWDRADREEAIALLRKEANRFSNIANQQRNQRSGRAWQWFLDQIRRTRPDLLKAAWNEGALPSESIETAAEAELITQEVYLTSTPNLELADPVVRFDQTILTIPPEWGAIDEIRAVAARAPKVARPPAFFAPTEKGFHVGTWWPSEPSITDPVQLETAVDDNQTPAETVRIALESQRDTVPHHGVTVRRAYEDEGEDENSALFHVYVQCALPHQVRITPGRGLRNPRDFSPEYGEKEGRGDTVVFDDLPRGRSADTGTTFTIRCDRPASWRATIEDVFPIVDILVDEKDSRIALSPGTDEGRRECWLIDDTGKEYRFQIDTAGGGIVRPGTSVHLVRRTLYRLEWGRKPW